jgi:hypothetical protein
MSYKRLLVATSIVFALTVSQVLAQVVPAVGGAVNGAVGAASGGVNWAVMLVTIFWFAVVMLVLKFSDYATRDLIPYMQVH